MSRPTGVRIDAQALRHNVAQVRQHAPQSKIVAMVKANAYGCSLSAVVPALQHDVDAFGVACLEEAQAVRALDKHRDCIVFQGVYAAAELPRVLEYNCQCVIHHAQQLRWLLDNPLPGRIRVWVKVNTGMNRLGFLPQEVYEVLNALRACPWVDDDIGLMTHFASADEVDNPSRQQQWRLFQDLVLPPMVLKKSLANSAAILSMPQAQADWVRPGIMLYGVSPFADQNGQQLGLRPVMRFYSAIAAIRQYQPGESVGYGATWQTRRVSRIAVVAVGYGDGYPRRIRDNTPVFIKGRLVPIVGRVSMDVLTVDVTDWPDIVPGDEVELWGENLPVETIAEAAGTIAYELLCRFSPRGAQKVDNI